MIHLRFDTLYYKILYRHDFYVQTKDMLDLHIPTINLYSTYNASQWATHAETGYPGYNGTNWNHIFDIPTWNPIIMRLSCFERGPLVATEDHEDSYLTFLVTIHDVSPVSVKKSRSVSTTKETKPMKHFHTVFLLEKTCSVLCLYRDWFSPLFEKYPVLLCHISISQQNYFAET